MRDAIMEKLSNPETPAYRYYTIISFNIKAHAFTSDDLNETDKINICDLLRYECRNPTISNQQQNLFSSQLAPIPNINNVPFKKIHNIDIIIIITFGVGRIYTCPSERVCLPL